MNKKILVFLLAMLAFFYFISCVPKTYEISGTITLNSNGLENVTVTLTQGTTTVGTTTTNASGDYVFTKIENGTYTVTPTLTGYTFNPATQSAEVNGENVADLDFTATPVTSTYSISGTILYNSTGLAGVSVALTPGTAVVTTNASGVYTFTNVANGSYTITPTLTGYTFTPTTQSATVNGANVTGKDFTASAATYSITGTILFNSAGLNGVSVALTGAATQNTTTNASGVYTFTNVSNGSYTITPTLTGYTFDPATLSANVNNADVTGKDFTAYDITIEYTLSGTITVNGGSGLDGVAVGITGTSSQNTTTAGGGNYSFTVTAGTYNITTVLTGYDIVPNNSTRSITVTNANVDFDFTAFNETTTNITYIYQIQGTSHLSPMVGAVTNVLGVVTAKSSSGYYIQNPDPDTNTATSEGLLVYTSSAPTVTVGDWVLVNGNIQEYGSGENLRITELASPTTTNIATGRPLPPVTIIGTGGRIPPSTFIWNDGAGGYNGDFEPDVEGLDFYESLEGMRVQINNAIVVTDYIAYGEVIVVGDNGANATLWNSRSKAPVINDENGGIDYNPEKMWIDSDAGLNGLTGGVYNANTGDVFSAPVIGIVDYSFGNFKILPTVALPSLIPATAPTREVSAIAPAANVLTVASFNVENFPATDESWTPTQIAAKIPEIAGTIVNAMNCPDIVVLVEMGDDSYGSNTPVVLSATQNAADLIAAMETAGAPAGVYKYVDIEPQDGTDGGWPEVHIRQGFLYNSARVGFISKPGAIATTAAALLNNSGKVDINYSPVRIDPTNAAFNAGRKPLIGKFTFNGKEIFIIANHLKSKSGDGDMWGTTQPPALGSVAQRITQAEIINQFVDSMLAIQSDANILIVGDMNEFQFETAMITLEADIMKNLAVELLPANDRFSYTYDGNLQMIDHIYAINNMFNTMNPQVDIVHRYAEYPDATRVNDHDPVLSSFTFPADTTPPALLSAEVNGVTLVLNYNEGLNPASVPSSIDFEVLVNSVARNVTNVAISGNRVILTLASAVVNGDTVTISYGVPGINPIRDIAGNLAFALIGQSVTNNTPGADVTPPAWAATYPKNDTPTSTGVTVRAQIDEAGTVYYVVLADGSTAPSPAQIKAGTDASDGALPANRFGNITMVANTENNAAITGLTAATSYDIYFIAEDTVPNLQLVADRKLLDITTTSGGSDLFISEYIEGTSNNKALEIYNGTGATVTLTGNYIVLLYANGSASPINPYNFSGGLTLANGDVFVIANPSANPSILAVADITHTVTNFNGDDAIALVKDVNGNGTYDAGTDTFIDVIGQIGTDPGTEWVGSGVSTLNMTLVRKSGITSGDSNGSDAFDPSIEWNGYATDTFSYLGSHTP